MLLLGGDVLSDVKNLTLCSLPKIAQFSIFTPPTLPPLARICTVIKISGGERGASQVGGHRKQDKKTDECRQAGCSVKRKKSLTFFPRPKTAQFFKLGLRSASATAGRRAAAATTLTALRVTGGTANEALARMAAAGKAELQENL